MFYIYLVHGYNLILFIYGRIVKVDQQLGVMYMPSKINKQIYPGLIPPPIFQSFFRIPVFSHKPILIKKKLEWEENAPC